MDGTATPSGVLASAALGAVLVFGTAVADPGSVVMASAAGTAVVVGPGFVALPGLEILAIPGVVDATQGISVTVTGVVIGGAAGTPTANGEANKSIAGVAVGTHAGVVLPLAPGFIRLDGTSFTAAAGALATAVSGRLTGVGMTARVGVLGVAGDIGLLTATDSGVQTLESFSTEGN
jgi:hypothetical protein